MGIVVILFHVQHKIMYMHVALVFSFFLFALLRIFVFYYYFALLFFGCSFSLWLIQIKMLKFFPFFGFLRSCNRTYALAAYESGSFYDYSSIAFYLDGEQTAAAAMTKKWEFLYDEYKFSQLFAALLFDTH